MIPNDTVIKYCNEGFNSDILTVVFLKFPSFGQISQGTNNFTV